MLNLQFDKLIYDVQKRTTALHTRRSVCVRERQKYLSEVKQAQDRVNAAPFVQEVLERVQKREHERAVGVYEQLLGAFLGDVLPGERHVFMDLYSERGAPALDVYIKKGQDAPLEDAYLGTGGSVTNLLSTGLRLVALLRSGKRRFLVLDESDCWIETALIPRYASIVAQMAKDLQVQVLMISHHNESLFAQHIPHRLIMSKQGSHLSVDWTVSSDIPTWEEHEEGIRSISLKHFQSHEHTIIPLSKEVTLLQGANDIGKSAITNALRAVFDGDANDTLIKHHKSSAVVTIDFGPDHILTWERFDKRKKIKQSYRLINSQGQVLHATDGTKPPEWMDDTLKIGRVEGLDVQIGQQQDPIFLLNQPASQRAKALAIGQESGHVVSMMGLEKQHLQEARNTIKQGEKILEALRREYDILQDIPEEKDWSSQLHDVTSHQQRLQQAKELLVKWTKVKREESVLAVPLAAPQMPTLYAQEPAKVARVWRKAVEKNQALNVNFNTIELPETSAKAIQSLLHRWRTQTHKVEALQTVRFARDMTLPEFSAEAKMALLRWKKAMNKTQLLGVAWKDLALPNISAPEVSKLRGQWGHAYQRTTELLNQQHMVGKEQQEIENKMSQVKQCPTCGQGWPHPLH